MPDISMCTNTKCLMRHVCYRYRAMPCDGWQAYIQYQPKNKQCDGFWAIEHGHRVLSAIVADKNNKGQNK